MNFKEWYTAQAVLCQLGWETLNGIIDRLTRYYRKQLQNDVATVTEAKKLPMGWETELYSIVVESESSGRHVKEQHIVRLFSGANGRDKAEGEYKALTYLYSVGYPVPKVFYLETDTGTLGKPFITMERIEGRTMMNYLRNASEEEQQSMMTLFVKLLVDLHALTIPDEFKGITTQEYLNGILSWGRKNLQEHRIDWLNSVFDWLNERKTQLISETPAIIHRDFHPNNIMLREDGSPVVLDWSAVTVGDYRDDLAWTILLGTLYLDPSFKGPFLKTYREISGREIQDIEFFEVNAIFRRLQDVAISFMSGPEKLGMRPGALEMMRQDSEKYLKIYSLLQERTGLEVPELKQLVQALDAGKPDEAFNT
jgi:aminoglycoside phosphotransferase (APT) family kinase protein